MSAIDYPIYLTRLLLCCFVKWSGLPFHFCCWFLLLLQTMRTSSCVTTRCTSSCVKTRCTLSLESACYSHYPSCVSKIRNQWWAQTYISHIFYFQHVHFVIWKRWGCFKTMFFSKAFTNVLGKNVFVWRVDNKSHSFFLGVLHRGSFGCLQLTYNINIWFDVVLGKRKQQYNVGVDHWPIYPVVLIGLLVYTASHLWVLDLFFPIQVEIFYTSLGV